MSGLSLRVLSALVLAPPVLLAVYLGPPFSDALVLVAGSIMAWEAARLAFGTEAWGRIAVVVAIMAAALGGGALGAYGAGLALLAVAALVSVVLLPAREGVILGAALAYAGAACLAFLWLRARPDAGLAVVAWLVAGVWASDIGAYFTGRAIGGPRLAPRISPKKTWAGLLGGCAWAAAASVACAGALPAVGTLLPVAGWGGFAIAGGILALVGQSGDLLESAFKRYFGVKDASRIIPGHGGVMDRVDGLLAASLVLACALQLTQGT